MQRRRAVQTEKWLILGILLSLVPLFQNMSLVEDRIDIRELAPEKPAGHWESPYSSLIPTHFHGEDISDVQQSFLSHNFDPMLKDLEVTCFGSGPHRFGGEEDRGPASVSEASQNKWRLGLVQPTRLRLQYENIEDLAGLKVTCEAQAGQEGLALKLSQPLSPGLHLGVTHETDLRQSQIQVDYRW